MDKQQELQKIAEEIERCPLCREGGVGKPVPGEGSADARVMFIGEAPGKAEAKTGRPFVGRTGKFFRAMIVEAGLEEDRIFITSPVHYLPETGKPSPAMIDHGRIHLLKQIEIIKPRLIVLLGNTACRAVLERNIEIAKLHGTVIQKNDITYLITFHPTYAMRFPEGRKKFIQDFAKLISLVNAPGRTPSLLHFP
jgi:DNA polymerase